MDKKQVQQRVLKDGKPLSLDLFTWDEGTKTFSSKMNGLVLDFKGISYCTFNAGSYCTFYTGYNCTFKTGYDCTFDTGSDCTFKTGYDCTFDTGYDCTFDTWSDCTFKTGYDCTFTCKKQCVVIRRDVYEIIEVSEGVTIKLNGYGIKGYEEVDKKYKLTFEGKEVEISKESAINLGLI